MDEMLGKDASVNPELVLDTESADIEVASASPAPRSRSGRLVDFLREKDEEAENRREEARAEKRKREEAKVARHEERMREIKRVADDERAFRQGQQEHMAEMQSFMRDLLDTMRSKQN